jgi:hypothetical protein
MNRIIEDKIGSTIYARLNAVNMSAAERQRALEALHEATLFVEGFAWLAKKIEQLRERLFLKPSLKH